jgi:hypothetical protein
MILIIDYDKKAGCCLGQQRRKLGKKKLEYPLVTSDALRLKRALSMG